MTTFLAISAVTSLLAFLLSAALTMGVTAGALLGGETLWDSLRVGFKAGSVVYMWAVAPALAITMSDDEDEDEADELDD